MRHQECWILLFASLLDRKYVATRTLRESGGVEARRLMRVLIEPEADCVLWLYVRGFFVLALGKHGCSAGLSPRMKLTRSLKPSLHDRKPKYAVIPFLRGDAPCDKMCPSLSTNPERQMIRDMVLLTQSSRSSRNKILAALNVTDYENLFSQLEPVSLVQGEVIYQAESPINYVYFPETSVFSMLSTMQDGRTVEVGPVGHEGLVGLRIFLGAETSLDQVIVHVAGDAWRLRASQFKAVAIVERGVMAAKLIRYTQMLLAMTARSSACNRLHSLEQQLARWLLMMSDYVGDVELELTHDLIALTIGTRRAGVTEAANGFRNGGVIDYRRGHFQIVDREGLEAMACECYSVVKKEYEQLYADLSRPVNL
jgi:CRP-like cAMP-binding protein